jgi:pentose-5-phosphate-3-epimerase/putative flippase GtrA
VSQLKDNPGGLLGVRPFRANGVPWRGTVGMPMDQRLRRWLLWLVWRYRYLAGFILYGFLSIVLEVALIRATLLFLGEWGEAPPSIPAFVSIPAFLAGMLFAFFMNAYFNFRVSRQHFARAFFLFTLVSILSYSLNLAAAALLDLEDYAPGRFITAACLFMIAYTLHRRFTFRKTARNLGLAVYASEKDSVREAFEHVGDLCDHVHVDLVDATFDPEVGPVDLDQIREARRLWAWQPFCLHVMSRRPLQWLDACGDLADCFLVHVDVDDDLAEVIARCRQRRRSVGMVWHHTVAFGQIMPYLPHVDFVMVLGVEQPGHSGQKLMDVALEAADMLDALASRYGYELIFDGGVTKENVGRIPARIIVSSSGVLRAENPAHTALFLRAPAP